MDISEQPEHMEQDNSGSFVKPEKSRKGGGLVRNDNIDFYSQNKKRQKHTYNPRHNDKNLLNQSHL
jgi:hypothetical protein